MGNLLNRIDEPEKLHELSTEELEALAAELREVIIDTVSRTGGHLAPSLGAVELTLALYSVFHLPTDKVVWDVGHQAYAHKLLTGRRERFSALRQWQGITGFPSRAEAIRELTAVPRATLKLPFM